MLDSRHRPLRLAALAASALLLAACGSAGATNDQPAGTLAGVGKLPDQAAGSATSPVAATAEVATTVAPSDAPTLPPSATVPGSTMPTSIGATVTGNKLLMVGDSIFAGTAPRYGNEACDTLVPLNWQVDVEAESGRAIDFGLKVLKEMVPQHWDVIVFFLGTNYGGNEVGYRDYLVRSLDTIGPDTPVVLLTTTVYAEKQNEVNTIVREEAALRPNVTVLDWGALSEGDGMLSGDGYHPSNEGRQLMVDAIAYTVGAAPVAPGKCLQSKNRSDIPNTPGAPTTSPRSSGGGGTTTTKAPAPTATVAPTATTTTTTVRTTTPSTQATTPATQVTTPPTQATTPPTQATTPPTQATTPPTQATSPPAATTTTTEVHEGP